MHRNARLLRFQEKKRCYRQKEVMIFAEEAERLIGVQAEDLVEESTGDGRYRHNMPAAMGCIIGLTPAFEVSIDDRNLGFIVKSVLNDDELALLRHCGSMTGDEALQLEAE